MASARDKPEVQDRAALRGQVVEMSIRAEAVLRLAVRAIVERDAELARTVLTQDRALDRLEVEVDRAAIGYLAAHRPAGRDLRFAAMVLKVVTDLERIGDLSGNVATRALELGARPGLEPDQSIVEMGHLAAQMVRQSSDAFVAADADQARRVIGIDAQVDELYHSAVRRWVDATTAHPDQASRALALCLAARDLERVADHAVNIAEMVVYLVEGRDVRHQNGG